MATSPCTVILGDLVKSRDISARKDAARRIALALSQTAAEIGSNARGRSRVLVAPPKLIRGIDEMAAVLQSPFMAYTLCRRINFRIYPLQFRFAVVSGSVDVGLRTGDVGRMDGPAFHEAARRVQRLKRQRELYSFRLLGGEALDPWLNAVVNLVQTIMDGWTDHQVRVAGLADKFPTQKAVAAHLRITPQAVSSVLNAAKWREVRSACRLVDEHLQTLG